MPKIQNEKILNWRESLTIFALIFPIAIFTKKTGVSSSFLLAFYKKTLLTQTQRKTMIV